MEAAVGAPDGGDQGGVGPLEDATPMDAYLRKLGLYRKLVAKDGSCLFRAVAEQVLHSQSRHVEVRMACVHYLRENRERFEAFIEGSFEEYLKRLENPQEWVGQVEISALSLMYRKDFIIYQEPNVSPSQVTENNFPEKVLLCFSNGNHYDIVYPITYKDSSAMCQSLLYELLYEKVFKTDVSKIMMGLETSEVADESNSEISDSEDDSCKSKSIAATDVNGFKPSASENPENDGNGADLPLSRKVLKSLNPAVYRNVEYEIWLKSKQAQQKRDYSIAAGLQYEVGDKCHQVRLDHNGKFSNADVHGVHSENGPVLSEELGKKHTPKNLKPPPPESWNTVSGKKMKKPNSGQNFHSDTDYRGPKNLSKPIKAPSALPPRLQHPSSGVKQHAFSSHSSGSQSQKSSNEHKNLSRTPSQTIRKPDRERTEDFDHMSRESYYFGLSPEERREKQAIEESRLLYEIQNRDEQAFPALSSPSVSQSPQNSNSCAQRKSSHARDRRGSMRRADAEERKDKDSLRGHTHVDKKPEPSTLEISDDKCTRVSSPSKLKKVECPSPVEQKPAEHMSLSNPAPLLVSPEVHLTPAVPSLPATVPAWPSEPTTFGPTGVPAQIPILSVTQTTGPDAAVSQAHLTPSPVPVSIQAVNQPLMPLPQTMSLYQDPLYPGFPCSEKGDRAIAPPYSLCQTGEDLPKDKNILRFFFNLGVKAYSCPMWAPHSYLYPLHQAYMAACRMYPKVPVPVYPQTTWFQEAPPAQSESDCPCTDAHYSMHPEASVNGQMPQTEIGPPAFSSPLVIPPSQVSEGHGQLSYQPELESETPGQLLHAEYEESLSGKNIYPQPPFGPNPFLGPVPIAPPFFPHVWYGYPFQGFVENPVMRQNIVLPSDDKGELDLPMENLDLSKECDSVSAVGEFPEARVEGAHSLSEAQSMSSKHEGRVEQSSQTQKADIALASSSPGVEGKTHPPTQILNRERETMSAELEPKRTIQSLKEKPEKVQDPKTSADVVGPGANSVDRLQRPKEDSSEDESEVSNILRSGRPKQFYNQTYGSRKYKNDWSSSGRGGYQHVRGEESWKGQPNRSRDEGFQYHRNVRGRPYRGDRRRSGMGDGHRGQHT